MIILYWMDGDVGCHQRLDTVDVEVALKRCEQLRADRRAGSKFSHITFVLEHPDQVGELGVSNPPPGYDWKKRRK